MENWNAKEEPSMTHTMKRSEYERMPKPESMWMADMQVMADELKEMYGRIEAEGLPDPDVDSLMEGLIGKATANLKGLKQWDDLLFLSYTYWACMEEMEKWNAATTAEVKNEEERELRAEAMLRTQVLAAWLYALMRRIELLGGKLEV